MGYSSHFQVQLRQQRHELGSKLGHQVKRDVLTTMLQTLGPTNYI